MNGEVDIDPGIAIRSQRQECVKEFLLSSAPEKGKSYFHRSGVGLSRITETIWCIISPFNTSSGIVDTASEWSSLAFYARYLVQQR
jgi:hypothetical protein